MKADALKIRSIMFQKGLSQAEIARQTGFSRNTINAICNGKSCGFEALSKVARIFDIDPRDLILLGEVQDGEQSTFN